MRMRDSFVESLRDTESLNVDLLLNGSPDFDLEATKWMFDAAYAFIRSNRRLFDE